MSRNRNTVGGSKAALSENEQIMTHVWHGLVDTLRLLPSVPSSSTTHSHKSASEDERRHALSEKKTLDEALEKLSVLIALKRGESVPPEAVGLGLPNVTVSSVSGGGGSTPGSASGVKRKRKLSYSASPGPNGTPVPTHNVSESLAKGGIRTDGSLESALTSLASPLPHVGGGARSGTPSSRELTGKQRRELYQDQLPLQPGRKVAFKVPANKGKDENDPSYLGGGGGGAHGVGAGGGGDEWILATIKRCIQQDKMRYEVQDDDDDKIAYNTTLRSIIPLPDPNSASHLSSHPSNLEDFPRDSQVLALYPDTTSFYRATVISAPIPGTGNGLGIRGGNGRPDPGAKRGVYRLMFVDDDGNVQEVHKDMVVAFPS